MKKKRNLKERVCAFVLALLLPLTSVLPDVTMVASAAGTDTPTDVTFIVTDGSSNPVEKALVELYVGDGAEVSQQGETDSSGTVIFSLDDVDTYQYKVTKETYEPSERKSILDVLSQDKVELSLRPMDEIEISPLDAVEVEEGKSIQLSVNNPVQDVAYNWSSRDTTKAVIDEASGLVTGVSRGSVDIKVSGNGRETIKNIKVKKTPEMIFSVTPNERPADSDQDVTSVTLEAQLPNDANGKVTFYKDSVADVNVIGTENVDASGKASCTVAEGQNFELIGEKVFWAKYSGSEDKYYFPVEADTKGTYLKKCDLKLKESSVTKNYGDPEFKVPEVDTNTLMDRDPNTLTYTSNNEEVVTVDADGNLTIHGAGTAVISVAIAQSSNYTASKADYTVEVKELDLGTFKLTDFTWQSVDKIYNGETDIPIIVGRLTNKENNKIVGSDIIEITAKAEVVLNPGESKISVGSYDTCRISELIKKDNKNYTYTFNQTDKEVTLKDGNVIKIIPRPVYLKIDQKNNEYVTVPYGSPISKIEDAIKQAAEGGNISLGLTGQQGEINTGAEEGIVGNDTLKLDDYAKIVLKGDSFYVGNYDYAIQPEITQKDAGNYEIRVDAANINNYSGRLKITQEVVTDQNIWDQVQLDINNSQNVSVNNGVIWLSAVGRGTFNIKAPSNYNKVNIKNSETDSQNNVLKINQDSIGEDTIADVENEIYLSVEGQSNTRTTSSNKEENKNNKLPKGMIKVDNQLPKVVFENLGTAGLYSALQGEIVFTNFTKDAHIENIQVTDGNGSGIQEYAYSLLEVHSGEDVIQSIQNAAQSADTSWIPMSGTEINVPSSPEGYYVVLVKAADKVGNTAVYSSNGLVVEIGQPNVELNITSKPTDRGVYSQDVEYELKVTDPGTIQSGIQKIEVLVESGNNKIEGDKATYTNSYTLENSDLNLLKKLDEDKNEYTFKELEEKSLYEFTGKLTADQCNSNQVKITVTAYDWAGNVMKKDFNALQIDITSPVLTVSYDNNKPKENEYFSDSRTMTIVYRERNFQEDMAMFDVSIDGGKTVETKTLTELGSMEGIAVNLISDTQSEIPLEERTDDRLITYEIQFNGGSKMDMDYVIKPSAKDAAGNPNKEVIYQEGTVAKDTFTIDKTLPVIDVSYDNNKPKNERYFNDNRKMTITYTERNFMEKGLTFDVYGSATPVSLDELKSIEGISVKTVESKDETSSDKHTYEITFGSKDKDIDFIIVPHIQDNAGNENKGVNYADNTKAAEEFTVDRVAPEMFVRYYTIDENGEKISDIADGEISTAVQDSMYKNKTIAAEVTIVERNFAAGTTFTDEEISVEESATDVQGNPVTDLSVDHNASAKQVDLWNTQEESQDKFIQTFIFAEDANYTFNIFYEDEAGNRVSLVKGADGEDKNTCYYFTVDKTAPSGMIKDVKENILESFLDTITFGYFDKENVKFFTSAQDATSPIKISYYKHYPGDVRETFNALDKDQLRAITDWVELSGTADDRYDISPKTYEYEFAKTEQAVPYEKIEDKAGNITYLNADGVVCEDKQSEINIDITTKAPETSFEVKEEDVVYNEDVAFNITVTDPTEKDRKGNNVYSGLSLVEYAVFVNGKVGPVEGKQEFAAALRQQSTSIDLVIPSTEYNSNDVVIKVRATDNSGNKCCLTKSLKIDITQPTIDIKYDNNHAANGKYFKDDRIMTVTYKERNINREGITFDFQAGDKTYSNITLKKLQEIADKSGIKIISIVDSQENRAVEQFDDERTLICTIQYTGGEKKDLDYKLVPHTEDQASNLDSGAKYEEGTKAPVEFTVDKLMPTMDVEYYLVNGSKLEKLNISTDEINRLYKNQTIRAITTVKERNFSTEDTFSDEFKQVIPHITWKMDDGSAGDVKEFEDAAVSRDMWKADGESGSNVWKQSFNFIADGDYSFNMEYTDLAGNKLDKAYSTHYFTVDKTKPEIKVTYDVDGKPVSAGEVEKNRLYKNKNMTATVQITERNFKRADPAVNFEKGQMDLTFKATDFKKGNVDTEDFTASADTSGKWTSDGYVRTQVFSFTKDANYELALTYKDLAGNEVVYGTHYFTVDKLEPTGEMKVDEAYTWKKLADMLTFGIFTQNTKTITMTSEDATSGVKSMQYYKDIPDVETRGEFPALTEEELNQIKDWTDGSETQVTANEQAIIYQKIVDMAGNVTYINSETGIIADNQKPSAPEITITMADPPQGIYGGDVPFSIDVTDPAVGGTYSGLKEVSYEVTSNGQRTQVGTHEWDKPAARQQRYHDDLMVYAEDNNTNHVTIKVVAIDYAGNQSEATKDIKIDTTPPEVQIEYNLNNPSNGKYYNATRTATVSVRERNFDPDAVDFTITNTDGTMPSISGWSISPSAGETDDAVNTCTVTFAADGDYTITMNCTDRAGNRSHYTQVDEFTIDQTVPTINVTFDNNNAANGTYYDKPRTATVTVNEHNFNGSEVQAAISASLQSQGISAPGVNGWSTSGDSHSATIYFGTDGDYSFTINYTDLAGNPATAYTQDKFTVDQTKPEIDIFDIADKSANNGTVAPGVKYSDVNYDASAVKISIKGPKHSEKTISGSRSSIPNGESIKMADFEHKESVDDVYTLTAQVSDLAGNTDEKSVTFSVNRFGSNFIFGTSTEAFLDQYYSNKEQDLVVTEVNVDTLVHNGISYGLDGELVNLTKGTDYTVKESGNEASWKSYEYTIKAANFEKEGLYNVTIDSKDRAKNEVNNKVKEANIEFVIDKTKPTVVITGVEDDGQYRTNNRDITIAVADNVAMDRLDVQVDGTDSQSRSYDAKEIQKQKGEIPFSLASSSNWQEIKAAAVDAAGNTAETSELRVLITANLLVQFYRNTPLVVGSSVGLAAIAAALAVFLSKKKKSNQKQA